MLQTVGVRCHLHALSTARSIDPIEGAVQTPVARDEHHKGDGKTGGHRGELSGARHRVPQLHGRWRSNPGARVGCHEEENRHDERMTHQVDAAEGVHRREEDQEQSDQRRRTSGVQSRPKPIVNSATPAIGMNTSRGIPKVRNGFSSTSG